MRVPALALIAVCLFTGSCARTSGEMDVSEALERGFFVPPDARDVTSRTAPEGIRGVSYRLTEAYPAESTLAQIRGTLVAPTWRPLHESWLNPPLPSSHADGWVEFDDQSGAGSRRVRQWVAQWLDDSGNLIEYQLRYEASQAPGAGAGAADWNDELRIAAGWFPATVVSDIRKQMGADGPLR